MRIALIGAASAVGGPAPGLVGLLPPGARFEAWPSRVPLFPYSPVEQAMQAIGHFDAARAAGADGCAVGVIDSLGDYGLAAIRAGVAMPVAGAGAAGVATAMAGSRRFAVVTVWPESMNFIVAGLLDGHGARAACVAICNVGTDGDMTDLSGPDGYLARVRDGEDGLLDRIVAAIGSAVAVGAEAILLGCTCMSPAAAKIAARVSVPVVDPLAEGVRAALSGTVAGAETPPAADRLALATRMVDAVAGEPTEACPTCVAEWTA